MQKHFCNVDKTCPQSFRTRAIAKRKRNRTVRRLNGSQRNENVTGFLAGTVHVHGLYMMHAHTCKALFWLVAVWPATLDMANLVSMAWFSWLLASNLLSALPLVWLSECSRLTPFINFCLGKCERANDFYSCVGWESLCDARHVSRALPATRSIDFGYEGTLGEARRVYKQYGKLATGFVL